MILTVHGMKVSGNCYKVQLLLEQLQLAYRWIEVDSLHGQTRTAEFLNKNPNGRVPILELAPGKVLPESNAILCYLADGSAYLPADRWQKAQALQWMFFEQYSHEPYVAVARFIKKFLPADHPRNSELIRLHERGYQALEVMERHLSRHDFFVDCGYSVGDIALYAYTHAAEDGGFEMTRFPSIHRWLERVRNTPRFVPMG